MKLAVYRILSFLLLPIAILFSVAILLLIRSALANPPLLIGIFFALSISIYTYASLNFLIRGIDGRKLLGKTSKDWLIVNAVVSFIYSIMAILQTILITTQPELIKSYAAAAKENAGDALTLNEAQIIQFMNGLSYFITVYGIVLFIHIILTFQYIKQYRALFKNEEAKN